jgi:hypothetical protein
MVSSLDGLIFKPAKIGVFGFWLLAVGFWLLAFGFWLLAFGFWLLAFGFSLTGIFFPAEIRGKHAETG